MNKLKLLLVSIALIFILIPLSAFADLTVTFIDVGHGDSALIQADGKNMLIDAGPHENAGKLLSYLSETGIKTD